MLPETAIAMHKCRSPFPSQVPPAGQKLIGWKVKVVEDNALLSSLSFVSKKTVLMLVGTPVLEIEAAARDLERGRKLSHSICSDLNSPVPTPARRVVSSREHASRDSRPINAAHGGVLLSSCVLFELALARKPTCHAHVLLSCVFLWYS